MNSPQNSPTTRNACFIGCSHSKRQLQFFIKNPMIKSKTLGGNTIGWGCQTVEPTVTLPMKKTKQGKKWENSVSGVSKSGFRMSRRIKHHVETVSTMEFTSDSKRPGENMNFAQNSPATRIACFIGWSHSKRQLQFCIKNPMIKSKTLGGNTIGWGCQTVEPTVTLPMKKTKQGKKWENSVSGVSKSGFRMSRRIKHHVETVSTMDFTSDSKRPGENMNFAQNSPTTRIACFIGCSHIKKQLQFSRKNPMIKSKTLSGSTIGWGCFEIRFQNE